MGLTLARIAEIAPDQASVEAARKLLKPASWPSLGADGTGAVWGECQGSGSAPYRVALSEADLGYKCTCPSRKFPCKHVLALMWMRAEGRELAQGERPGWVAEWLLRRRGPTATANADGEAKPPVSLEPAAEAPDPKATAQAAAQRERNRAEREAAILAGLEELDLWILDQLEAGLAAFATVAAERCRLLARRLVDAKASGLAGRVEQLPGALFGLPEAMRGDFLIEALGGLHLIAEAYRRQDALPEALRADVRQCVGWSLTREALLADPAALRVRSRWMVLATASEVLPDRLRRLDTWLARLGDGDGPAFALLMDFAPVSASAAKSLHAPGEALEAELVFHPSPAPLRAIIAQQSGAAVPAGRWPAPADDVAMALDRYEAALAERPWLGDWPLAVHDAVIGAGPDGLVLAQSGGAALPVRPRNDDMLLPLAGLAGIDAFGLWDGRRFDLKYAETPLGPWIGP
jgi:hypothetical protein